MTTILGLNAYHGDAAACLVVDGELVCAVEEERLNRVKHSAGFPTLSARLCLEQGGVDPGQLDHIAVGRDPSANLARKLLRAARTRRAGFLRSRIENASRIRDVGGQLADALEVPRESLRARLHHVEHHLAHVASAFLVSPFDEAAVLSVDGFGDFASTMLAEGRGNRIEVLDRVLYPHSLGVFYTALTQWLGFPHYGDEGKVMGLAPYGEPVYLDELASLLELDGPLFELDLDYFLHHVEGVDMTWDAGAPTVGRLYSDRLVELLGEPRGAGAPLEKKHEDVAASLQKTLERAYVHVLHALHRRTGRDALCLAGGVALNAVANGLVRSETPFEQLYIQPAAGDSGTAVGAAFHVWNQVLGHPREFEMSHAYVGPEFGDPVIESAIRGAGLRARRLDDDELFPYVAGRIAEGAVVGWFQGRMEFGPRALGNRSILADPRRGEMKDVLNERIKHREPFRPFAPSILAEAAGEWFEDDYESPFMIVVYTTRADKRELIPAVNHVDDTGRVQTVRRDDNPRYHRLIEAFAERTGVPVLLNTSFNEHEPIVCTPADALACFAKTRIDVLVLGNSVVER